MRTVSMNWYTIEITWKKDGNARDEKHRTHAKYCMPRQVHGAQVVYIDDDRVGKTEQFCDWVIGEKGIAYLWVYVGDCCPIVIVWKKYFAVLHGSWKTLHEWIVYRALDELLQRKEVPHDLQVFFWPSIKKEVYEVWREFYDFFPTKFLQKIDWNLTFDLIEYAISQLEWKDVKRDNILIDTYCTYQNNDRYFSHRKGEPGRNFVWVFAQKE